MNYINEKTNLAIKPENIKHFFIDSDYENAHIAMMYAVLNIDKSFYDEIITNAKTATIITNIYKILTDDATETKILTSYKGECSYFISGDINYNKEIDYATTSDDTAKKEDIYKQVQIGLMYKECIDNNKQTNNTTIKDTTMINAVASYLTKVPLLIENFTYNDNISQLVVPPQDSLFKTINFFNSIKVFYDTPYRFFIEPGCTYLISSSGKAVQKASEKYNTIILSIHSIIDDDANILGMEEDDTNKCYRVDVNVLDTHYTIDNDTCKTVNNISSIINPSKENSLIALGDIQKAMASVEKIRTNILNSITGKLNVLKTIPSAINNSKIQINASTSNVSKDTDGSVALVSQAIEIIQAIPEEQPTPVEGEPTPTPIKTMSALEKGTVIAKLNIDKQSLITNTTKFNNLNTSFAESSNSMMNCMGKTTTVVPSLLNAITAINITDNTAQIKSTATATKVANIANQLFTTTTLLPHIDNGTALITSTQNIIADLTAVGVPELTETVTSLQTNLASTVSEVANVTTHLNAYKAFPVEMGSVYANISPYINKFDGLTVNLKRQFTNLTTDIQDTNTESSTLSSIINDSTSILNSLKTKGISLSSLADISKDINSVKDISQIGKVGVSKFNVGLNFNGTSTINDGGTRVIRINNDNSNKIKNIKANMENKSNKLTLNKNDLDTSVFTINKEYVVKNYDAHSNKDGRFLLNRKVEIFLREDTKFLLNTMLEFDKLADDNIGATKAAELGKKIIIDKLNTIPTASQIISNATDIINTIKNATK